MASTCRICQQTGVKGLIPLSHTVSTQRKPVFDMLIAVGGSSTSKVEEYDRIPQHVCSGCLEQLEQSYSLRMLCRSSLRKLLLHPLGGTSQSCLICYGKKELFAVNGVHERWKIKISDMIEQLIGVELIKERSQKYACKSCSIKLYAWYEFKGKCLRSEANWLENVLYPWERMKVDDNNPEHLVADLYAKVVQYGEEKAHCSICLLSVDLKQLGEKCEGCMLEFRNCDEMQTNEVSSPAEDESSAFCPLEMSCDEEEINPQELDALPEEDDDERLEVAKLNTEYLGYVEEPEKVFDIIEEYPDDPFPTVLRKGPWCCKCIKFFATKSDMADHQTQNHPPSTCSGTLPCDFCESSANKLALAHHRKSMDTFVFDFCRSCQIVFEYPKLFRQHKAKYHMDFKSVRTAESNFDTEVVFYYDCCVSHCANRYSSEERLLKHCAVAHGESKEPVPENMCQYCKVVFISQSNLQNHWRNEKNLYKCRVEACNFMRIDKKTIWLHCSRQPHSRYVRKKNMETKILAPDMKHFTVIGELDNNTYILQRQCLLCCRCFLLFETKEELAAHCELHRVEDGQPFHCQICSRGYESKSGYGKHSVLQEDPIHYYCRTCKMILWRKVDHVNHKVAAHLYDDDLSDQIETVEDHFFTCCGCWKPFETEEELVEHRWKYHPPLNRSPRKPKCDYCHKFMDTTEQLEQHITFYESKMSHRCKVAGCIFQTKNMNRIRRHILFGIHKDETGATITIKSPTDYRCCVYMCGFRCIDYDAMIEHGKAVHTNMRYRLSIDYSGWQFTCPVCCKGFPKQTSLISHKLGNKYYRCRGCQKYFRRNMYLTHSQECTARLKCRHCGQVMSSKNTLRKHLHQIHSVKNGFDAGATMHICSICGKQRTNIQQHMKSHAKKRIYKCSTCGEGFFKYAMLTLHKRTHQHQRDFPCRHGCAKRYKASGDRDRHEKSVHLGIKPFVCNLCPESFVRDRDLRLHQRKHTGMKLYPCSYCLASFDKVGEYEDHCMTCVESIE